MALQLLSSSLYMRKILIYFLSVYSCLTCACGNPQAELVSEQGNVSVPVGGSARLTCLLTNLDPRQVIWRRGFEVSPSGGAALRYKSDRRRQSLSYGAALG